MRPFPSSPQWLEPIAEEHESVADVDGPAETAPETAPAVDDARIAALEARVTEQEDALRRVLTLLVDWVEADRSEMAAATSAMVAGVAELHQEHVPIRAPAAWDHAA